MAMKKGKSISIFSTKGGSGKTSIALNLAGVFSLHNKKTLVVDLDLTSGAIAIYLNKIPIKNIDDIMGDYINHSLKEISEYTTNYNENIDFIASCPDPRRGTKITESIIPLIIEKSIYYYDYVIFDMSHSLNAFNLTILDNTDLTYLVLTNNLVDIKNAANMVGIFQDAKKDNYKIILNSFIDKNRKYYSLFDLKSVIRANIDYHIDDDFYLKSIDSYIADGKIITLEPKMPKYCPKAFKTFKAIVSDIMEDEHE